MALRGSTAPREDMGLLQTAWGNSDFGELVSPKGSAAPALQGRVSPVNALLPLMGVAAAGLGSLSQPVVLPAVETFVFYSVCECACHRS